MDVFICDDREWYVDVFICDDREWYVDVFTRDDREWYVDVFTRDDRECFACCTVVKCNAVRNTLVVGEGGGGRCVAVCGQ